MPNLAQSLRLSWTSTLRLPKSSFPARPVVADRPKYLKRCTDDLYAWQRTANNSRSNDSSRSNNGKFILHDGPPYANGDLHVGHALNKILKDIICRYQLSQGKSVEYVPGWDCHGLPIELKALQRQKKLDESLHYNEAEPQAVRKAARELAIETVEEQKRVFCGWGIMADWANAWKTMDNDFELRQLGVFHRMVEKGLIYRKFKPVYWSPSSRTALAEAELEYKADHISTAAFVKFPIVKPSPALQTLLGTRKEDVSAVIWTTTPWTLPGNKAIAVHNDIDYSFVESEVHGLLIIATSRLSEVTKLCGEVFTSVKFGSIHGSELVGTLYRHPAQGIGSLLQKFLHADFVSAESGTGLVHLAPGHGMDDYKICLQHGTNISAPVDDKGCFTIAALPYQPEVLTGKDVLAEGNAAIINYLAEQKAVLGTHQYSHNYPYDWRSKQPVIVRATEQWFADVGEIRAEALASLEQVNFMPASGKERLSSFVKNRTEWCISRQRAWGVPIPVLYERDSGAALLTSESVLHILSVMESRGTDAWWTDDEFDPQWVPDTHRKRAQYTRGRETMDVWFDSGTSWTKVGHATQESLLPAADLCIEGTDQHRGWFQSSLLTKIAYQIASGTKSPIYAPFRTLVTHGFTLDQQGKKMSKSEGNVISPEQIMSGSLLPPLKKSPHHPKTGSPIYDAMGPDALRLWVAGCDYTKDVVVSEPVLKSVTNSLSKLRVTFKLLLGLLELHDAKSGVLFQTLGVIDQIALIQLRRLFNKVATYYEKYEFHGAVTTINQYINTELSAFYIESVKDRMYAGGINCKSRLDAQTVLWEIFRGLSSMLAPLVPILIQEVCDYLPEKLHFDPFRLGLSQNNNMLYIRQWEDNLLEADMPSLFALNAAVKAAQELARADKKMGSSLQSFVLLEVSQNGQAVRDLFLRRGQALNDLLIVSDTKLWTPSASVQSPLLNASWSYSAPCNLLDDAIVVHVYAPEAEKCFRCWRYAVSMGLNIEEPLCERCVKVLEDMRDHQHKCYDERPQLKTIAATWADHYHKIPNH